MSRAEGQLSSGEPTLAIEGGTATLTLRRPELANRISRSDLHKIRGHLAQVNAAQAVRVLRFMSSGKYFCSGYDLDALNQTAGADADEFEVLVDEIEAARPVTIAAINGGVYGGATDLCLACDFRIGADTVELQMPALKLGIHLYRGGLERYVTRLGLDAAKRLLLTAEKVDADTLLRIGFLTDLVAAGQLAAGVDELTRVLTTMAPLALQSTKKHLNQIARGALDPASLAADIARARGCADAREGLLAWQERRAPVFTGA